MAHTQASDTKYVITRDKYDILLVWELAYAKLVRQLNLPSPSSKLGRYEVGTLPSWISKLCFYKHRVAFFLCNMLHIKNSLKRFSYQQGGFSNSGKIQKFEFNFTVRFPRVLISWNAELLKIEPTVLLRPESFTAVCYTYRIFVDSDWKMKISEEY